MALILSHKTACEYWLSPYATSDYLLRNVPDGKGGVALRSHSLQLLAYDGFSAFGERPVSLRRNSAEFNTVPSAHACKELLLHYPDVFRAPLHLMVFDQLDRRKRKGCVFHVCDRRVPLNCFYELPSVEGHRVWVVSPELCYLQMASHVSFLELVKLGNSLCSQFCIGEEAGLRHRVPVTDVLNLRKYCLQRRGHSGRSAALRVLDCVFDGAASPRETQTALLLSMLRRRGGYGLPAPVLNCRIELAGQRSFACDLLWRKEKIVIEYDSDQWHAASVKLASDSRRRSALGANGYQVISVTNAQLMHAEDMDNVALALARALGKRLRGLSDSSFKVKQRAFRHELLHSPFISLP